VVTYLVLQAASDVDTDLDFLVMGDWGGQDSHPYTTGAERHTAHGMNDAAKRFGAKFALALGDNFYDDGVNDVSDKRFQETFENCFSGESLSAAKGFKFHVVAGNHDHNGNVQAQIDYSSKSERWSFPSAYYSFTAVAPDGATIQFVMIDTVLLAGNSDQGATKPSNFTLASDQLAFIKTTLEKSTADFLVVAGHYPVFSIAENGPTRELQPDRFSYLRDYKVSAYLSGHDHNEQYIDVGDNIQYHVIGSAHKGNPSRRHAHTLKSGQLKFYDAHPGFASVSVSKSGMQIKHWKSNGELLFAAPVILPRAVTSKNHSDLFVV